MKPASLDLRERVTAALEKGKLTQPAIAEKYVFVACPSERVSHLALLPYYSIALSHYRTINPNSHETLHFFHRRVRPK